MKILIWLHYNNEMFNELIKKTGLPRQMVESALEAAIGESLCSSLDMYDCDVDLDNKTATGVFRVSQDMTFEEASFFNKTVVAQDIVTVEFDFVSLPKQVVKKCGEAFPRILLEMEAAASYRKWASKRHMAVDAVVVEKNDSEIMVDLGDQPGFMLKKEWVSSEAEERYREGKPISVYVLKVKKAASTVSVFLSRQSRNLPAVLLKSRLPWHVFVCVYRKAGQKSVILTDCPVADKTLQAARKYVEEELGDRLKLKPL